MTRGTSDRPVVANPAVGERLTVDGMTLELRRIPGRSSRVPLVFLHEGLGSVTMWRDFPAEVGAMTGSPVLLYSRPGHGASEPASAAPGVDFMHVEADRLARILDTVGVDAPVLVGHSDGASIALLYAARSDARLRGLVMLAPHVFVEDVSIESIEGACARFETTDFKARLGRYHRDAEHTFRRWSDIWLDPSFRTWNIEASVSRVRAPMLVIQGRDDIYGTGAQYEAIARHATVQADVLVLSGCGHRPHRDRPATVREAIASFTPHLRRVGMMRRSAVGRFSPLSFRGAAFGPEPILTQSAWFRPHNRSEDVNGLFLVGAGTHPGAGLPGVVSSAAVLERLLDDVQL